MNKVMIYCNGKDEERYEDFTHAMLTAARSLAEQPEFIGVKCTLTEEPPPKKSIIPFRADKVGLLSLYYEKENKTLPNKHLSPI